MKSEKQHSGMVVSIAILVAIALVTFCLRLGNTHLWDQDEGYYASAAAEMFAKNDWVVPTFNGELFAHKPPMMYWGMMIGFHLFGVNELGARFVSSLMSVGSAVVTYWLGRRLFDGGTGLLAGLALSTSLMFVMVGRSATADSYLTFFVALSMLLWCNSYWNARGECRDQRLREIRILDWGRTYAVMGLAVLTKGPIGFLFPMAAIGLFLLSERASERCSSNSIRTSMVSTLKCFSPVPFLKTVWLMRPWIALVVITLIVAPWTFAVQWKSSGLFLQEFIGVHHFGRFSQAMDNHSGPIYYYLIACLLGLYPWTAFAIPTGMNWLRDTCSRDHSRACRLITSWIVVYLAIFSLASTKLPNYVLPAYPALALVIGKFMANVSSNSVTLWGNRWTSIGWSLLVLVGLTVLSAFPITTQIMVEGESIFEMLKMEPVVSRSTWLLFGIAGLPLLLAGLGGAIACGCGRPKTAIAIFSMSAKFFILVLSQFIAPELDRLQGAQRLAERTASKSGEADSDKTILAMGRFKPSLVFYSKQPVQFCESVEHAVEELKSNPNATLLSTVYGLNEIEELTGSRRLEVSPSLPGEPAWAILESAARTTLSR
jgi:4-amino-4-deoxy-L-arabinose transferase-like glycosyltransferase